MGKTVEISQHAWEQMTERGASEQEVFTAIEQGGKESALLGRTMYRKNFQFDRMWRGRHYKVKQVAPIVVEHEDELVVVTVYTFYF